MSQDGMLDYYKKYHAVQGAEAYAMGRVLHTSRVLFLQQYVREHTPKGGRVLDVGCGDMSLAKLMPEFTWVGVDIDPAPSGGLALQCDIGKPPYPLESASFDTVVCSEVLEHVWDLRLVEKEIRRVIKPG